MKKGIRFWSPTSPHPVILFRKAPVSAPLTRRDPTKHLRSLLTARNHQGDFALRRVRRVVGQEFSRKTAAELLKFLR